MSFSKMAKTLKNKLIETPNIALILGSGLGYLTDSFKDSLAIPYKKVEGFPASTVKGHKGRLVAGYFMGKYVIAMDGRFHYYEGHDIKTIVIPLYVFKELGVKSLIITNAAGAINKSFVPGDLVAIEDIINFSFKNPLIGPNNEKFGPRFPDMSSPTNKSWINKIEKRSIEQNIELKRGTYIWTTGPMYETPGEINMFRKLGADMIGMSTVPEIIVANYLGLKVISFSCITNMASGILEKKLEHSEVVQAAKNASKKFEGVVKISIEEEDAE
ncbi:MAG: purine-nucleoside phosphorylase [Kosmotogaceae bacterium]